MKAVLIAIGSIALIVTSSIWHGYVVGITWGWFITPAFGLARMNIATAIGVTAAIRLVTYQHIEDKSEEKPLDERWAGIFLRSFVIPGFMLFFCWIVKHWM
jgi:hypothetical protein